MKNDTGSLLSFLDESVTPYHAVRAIARELASSGAKELVETDPWKLEPGALYYFTRGGGSLFAFRAGKKPPCQSGFMVGAAHTDSPTLKCKSFLTPGETAQGRLTVEEYGAAILHSWLDKPLSVAGRIMAKTGKENRSVLVDLEKPFCVIPSLAIHMNRDVNKGTELDARSRMKPVAFSFSRESESPFAVRDAIAEKAGIAPEAILSGDLMLYDPSGAVRFGAYGEFLNAPRLDNLQSCFCLAAALADSPPSETTQVIALFDYEEIGSNAENGAGSSLLRDLLSRLCGVMGDVPEREAEYRAFARSRILSLDAAQALYAGYPDRYDTGHVPYLNGGPVLKKSVNRRYASDCEGDAIFRSLCDEAGVPCQEYEIRSESTSGSIGPIAAARSGIFTIDAGCPLLAMHSSRETAGAQDHESMIKVLGVFFTEGPVRSFSQPVSISRGF